MLETLQQVDTAVFRWINGHQCAALDWPMWVVSQHWCIAAVLAIAAILIIKNEERKIKNSAAAVCLDKANSSFSILHSTLYLLAAIGLCFLLADQGSVHLFKDTVCRLRPCHALEGVNMFHTRCGGQYGFVSSHAANTFAVVALLFAHYRKTSPWGVALLTLWAAVVGYSRVYLGKHYPGDVLGGALYGIVCGLAVATVVHFVEKKFAKSETK